MIQCLLALVLTIFYGAILFFLRIPWPIQLLADSATFVLSLALFCLLGINPPEGDLTEREKDG